MAITVKDWQDAPSTATPINAAALEDLETRLAIYADFKGQGFNVKEPPYNALGDGSTNDTAAIEAAFAAAALVKGTVWFPLGVFMAGNLKVPNGVSLRGENQAMSILRYRNTDGGVFITFYGSHQVVEGLTIDGQRESQPENVGLAAIMFTKPVATSAGSSISGGMTLTSGAAAAATSLAVNDASLTDTVTINVLPDDVISLVEGSTIEHVRVHPDYTPGANTITLRDPLKNTFTTAAKVAVMSTGNAIRHCIVYGCGRDGIAMWHAFGGLIQGNTVYDCSDTAIDLPSGGNRDIRIIGNTIETNGRWGVAVDEADSTTLGPTSQIAIEGNTIRFLNGGSDANGVMLDGIFVGSVQHVVSSGNTIDLRKGGRAGVALYQTAQFVTVNGNTVEGGNLTDQRGIRTSLTDGSEFGDVSIVGNVLRNLTRGVDLGLMVRATVMGNVIRNVSEYAINVDINADTLQDISVIGNVINGSIAGVRFGGTGGVGSKARAFGNVISGSSFADIVNDSGWTMLTYDSGDRWTISALWIGGAVSNGANYLQFFEQTADSAAGSANTARVFARDNGSGKTQLVARFPSGATQVIATEP
jgi:hypothetical protein